MYVMTLEECARFEPDTSILEQYLDRVIDVPSYKDPVINQMFESELRYIREENDGIFSTLINGLKSLISSIVGFISKCVDSIRIGFSALFNKRGIKEALNQFTQAMKDNPEIRKIRIAVVKTDVANKDIDNLIKKVQQAQEKAAKGKLSESENAKLAADCAKELAKSVGAYAKDVTTLVAADAAVRYCKANHDLAVEISKNLDNESSILNKIPEKVVKKSDVDALKADIQQCAELSGLSKLKAKLYYRKARTVEGATREAITSLSNICIDGKVGKKDAPLAGKLLTRDTTAVPTAIMMNRKDIVGAGKGIAGAAKDIKDKHSKKKKKK